MPSDENAQCCARTDRGDQSDETRKKIEEMAAETFRDLPRDDPRRLAQTAKEELEWCAKETGYLRTETGSEMGSRRVERIRDRLEEIDAMLAEVDDAE